MGLQTPRRCGTSGPCLAVPTAPTELPALPGLGFPLPPEALSARQLEGGVTASPAALNQRMTVVC